MSPHEAAPARPRRDRHLMDLSAPRAPRNVAAAERSLSTVQKWVMSTLAVTTILHLSVGLIILAMTRPVADLDARIGLNVIAGAFGVVAVAAGLAIHGRSLLS